MTPMIDMKRTGKRIRLLMDLRGVTVRDVKIVLGLGCVQSIYHWLDGKSMPALDNLYALSQLLRVPMDLMVCGNRQYEPDKKIDTSAERLLCYYVRMQNCRAA